MTGASPDLSKIALLQYCVSNYANLRGEPQQCSCPQKISQEITLQAFSSGTPYLVKAVSGKRSALPDTQHPVGRWLAGAS
jgi:hypothetical protein